MKRANPRNVGENLARAITAALLITVGIACGTQAFASERRNVWERGDEFVAVEKQENASAAPNEHPAKLAAETLRATLSGLRVQPKGSKESALLFTEGELETLGDALQQGLSLARSDEDVTFALVGLHPALLGLFKQPMVTTGRLFVRGGRLNLILGAVHEPVNDRDDRRLKPFIPGSRLKKRTLEWRVTTNGEAPLTESDRDDWFVLPLVTAAPEQPAVPGVSREAKPAQPSRPTGRSVEERLILLNDLKAKGLLSDEEYQAKRRQILNEL
ncbi:MAG TPA: SHOCT domain-containing protein [Geobacteraceae bacterium]